VTDRVANARPVADAVISGSRPVVPADAAALGAATPVRTPAAVSEPAAARPSGVGVANIPALPSVANDNVAIRRTLQTYEQAYEHLDARTAAAVWPSLDVQALKRAFDGLKTQSLQFDRCQFDVSYAVATAVCTGSSRIVRRVGNPRPLVESRQWTFHLKRLGVGNDWKIDSVTTTR